MGFICLNLFLFRLLVCTVKVEKIHKFIQIQYIYIYIYDTFHLDFLCFSNPGWSLYKMPPSCVVLSWRSQEIMVSPTNRSQSSKDWILSQQWNQFGNEKQKLKTNFKLVAVHRKFNYHDRVTIKWQYCYARKKKIKINAIWCQYNAIYFLNEGML